MTNNELRNVALLMQGKVKELAASITPAYAEVSSWTLNLSDAKLPTIAQVKAVLQAYTAVTKPALALYDELREINSSSEEAITLPDVVSFENIDWENVTNKPTSYPPTAHSHVKADVSDFAHSHVKADVSDFAHSHVKADVSDFAHSHAYADITSKPSTFPSSMVLISYVGNAAGSRTLSHSGGFAVRYIICVWSQYLRIWDTSNGLSNVTSDRFTLTGANTNDSGIS